jgi:hypothetical protein
MHDSTSNYPIYPRLAGFGVSSWIISLTDAVCADSATLLKSGWMKVISAVMTPWNFTLKPTDYGITKSRMTANA